MPPVAHASTALWIAASAAAQTLAEFQQLMPPTRTAASCVAAADFDGDGRTDIVLAGQDQAVEVLALRGSDGAFVALPRVAFLDVRPVRMATADFDGDGTIDVYVAAEPAECIGLACARGNDVVLWNDGRGGLDPGVGPQPPAAADRFTRAVAAGDIDGDGDVDLLLAVYPRVWFPCSVCAPRFGPSADVLLRNDGMGGFTASVQPMTVAGTLTECALLVDLDRDGDLDALVSRRLAHGLDAAEDRIYWNDGVGNFGTPSVASQPRPALELVAADLDGDGDADLLRVDAAGLAIYEVTASGPARRAMAVPAGLGPCSDVRVGDWNGDGRADIAVRRVNSLGSTEIVPLFGASSGFAFATRPGTATPSNARHPETLDADGDGDLDLVLVSDAAADHELQLNDGTGRWRPAPSPFANGTAIYRDAAVGDFDGDGDLDVAVVGSRPARHQLLIGNGWGDLAPRGAGDFTSISADTVAVVAGDVDGDGDLDLVGANAGGPFVPEPARLFVNDGTGRFAATALPVGDLLDVALGDVDGDGDLDLIATGFAGTFVLRNGPQGFGPAAAVPGSGPGASLDLADLDGDGDLDALTTAWARLGTQLLRNDGTGQLSLDAGALPPLADDTTGQAIGDVDGDGDLDVLLANDGGASPQANRLLRNLGNGTFANAPYPGDLSRTSAVHLVDLDGDGDLDAIEVAYRALPDQPPTRVLANNGTGFFVPVPDGAPPAPDRAYRYAFADFDRDGDPDGLLLGEGPFHLHANTRRHLAARALARLGRTLTVDLFGAPGRSAAIAASPLSGTTVLPQGVLGLAPAWTQVLTVGTVPASGTLSFGLPIPNTLALEGVVLYWQGIVGPPDRLTNRLATRLSRY